MPPSALIFDVDGTMIETAELHRSAFNSAFADVGLDWRWTAAAYTHVAHLGTDRDKLDCYADTYGVNDQRTKKQIGLLDKVLAQKTLTYARMIENGIARLRPGVARLVQEARNARVPLALASTCQREEFEPLLQNHLGLDMAKLFDTIITIDDLIEPNATDAYWAAISGLGIDPNHAVAFDDSGQGTQAASGIGLNVIGVPGIYTSADDFEGAFLVISDLGHPAAPFQVIKGDAENYNFVSLDALDYWIAKEKRMAA